MRFGIADSQVDAVFRIMSTKDVAGNDLFFSVVK
jgi:hypothetical protein